jgi:MFS family permease
MPRQTRSRLRPRINWQQTFAALKYPNYRLWFFGQLISLFGSWMQMTAQGYLVFELTDSAAYLGYVSFAWGLPSWLLMLYAGVIADRVPRRTLLVLTQTSMMLLAFVLAVLTFSGLVQPWQILVLSVGSGIANAFDAPARQAFVLEMVDREDLINAIALNSTMFNTGTAIGPAIAGIIYALAGPGWCFLINAVTYIAIIVALLMMRLRPQVRPARRASMRADLGEGLRYVAGHPLIRALIGLIAVTTLFGYSFSTLVPAWAVRTLGGDSTTNGLLQSARGVGALAGALTIASLGRFRFRGRLLALGSVAFPSALLAFAGARWLPLSLLLLVGVGSAVIMVYNLANSLVQTLCTDELRGRVMSVYSLMFMGLMPLGGLWAGAMADRIGEPLTVVLGASVTLGAAGLAWAFMPRLRALE